MKYYLSYNKKILGYMMNKDEAEKALKRIHGIIDGIEIMGYDDKTFPIRKHKHVKARNKISK
jgi:hypothetical protein